MTSPDGSGWVECPECEGSGDVWNDDGDPEECDQCDGTGEIASDNA